MNRGNLKDHNMCIINSCYVGDGIARAFYFLRHLYDLPLRQSASVTFPIQRERRLLK